MSKTLRRWLGATVAAAVAAAVALVVLTVASPAASADTPDFYTPPSPLPAGNPGDVIRSAPITYSSQSGVTGARIMYLSKDSKNQPVAVTGTVLVPSAPWTGGGPRPIVAYDPFTAGMGTQCIVSKTLAGDVSSDLVGSVQTSFINPLLQKGFAVAETDYPRSPSNGDEEYVVRAAEAQGTLDAIRAAQRLPGSGLSAGGPVAIEGYSQGGGAAAAAVELAPSYAPDLKLVGAYAGAPPADLKVVAQSLDGGTYVAFEAMAVLGTNAAYPELNITGLLNQQGVTAMRQLDQDCTLNAVFGFAFQHTSSYTTTGKSVSDYLSQEPYASMIAAQTIGNLKPTAPVEVESAPNDDVVPNSQVVTMAKSWCSKGATVQYNNIFELLPTFTHALAAFTATGDATNWLSDRFAGKSTSGNCGQF
ncbi:MAG TPA: lipase family protein [Pseudonocardiaceae bacterium]|nr:lipase family protein [Pseudonocardiaceae bacterium]